jgi:hypothetical protein
MVAARAGEDTLDKIKHPQRIKISLNLFIFETSWLWLTPNQRQFQANFGNNFWGIMQKSYEVGGF